MKIRSTSIAIVGLISVGGIGWFVLPRTTTHEGTGSTASEHVIPTPASVADEKLSHAAPAPRERVITRRAVSAPAGDLDSDENVVAEAPGAIAANAAPKHPPEVEARIARAREERQNFVQSHDPRDVGHAAVVDPEQDPTVLRTTPVTADTIQVIQGSLFHGARRAPAGPLPSKPNVSKHPVSAGAG